MHKRCLIALAAALLAAPATAQDILFQDVSPIDPYAQAVQALAQMGVIRGYPDGTFRGQQPVTRYELTVVVGRMMKYFEESLPPGTSLRPVRPDLPESLLAMGGVAAADVLRRRAVQLPRQILDKPDQLASMDEVVEVMSNAMARLIEMTVPATEPAADEAGVP